MNGGDASTASEGEGDVVRQVRAFRGLCFDQAVRYLEHLDGDHVEEGVVEADDWRATLSVETVPVGPTLRLDEVTVAFEGDPETLEWVVDRFYLKAFRAPG